MCAIIDANVASEVFGTDRPEAGARFFDWINARKPVAQNEIEVQFASGSNSLVSEGRSKFNRLAIEVLLMSSDFVKHPTRP